MIKNGQSKKLLLKYNSILFAIILCLIGTITSSAQTWSPAASMAGSRYAYTATLLSNGKVLVTGGSNGSSELTSSELYDPVTNTWSIVASMTGSRQNHTATLLSNGKVLVTGGYRGFSYLSSCEIYDPLTNSWSIALSMADSRRYHTATLLSNGKVLVTGGHNLSGYLSSCELYDPVTNTWSIAASMANSCQYHTTTLLPNGRVLVTGGYNGNSLSSCELYDPVANNWSEAVSMADSRHSQTATLLSNGMVLVTGGNSGSSLLASCELYDPQTNSWSMTASMARSRYGHTSTFFPNGRVLVTGGFTSSCELYDTVTGIWSTTASMAEIRSFHTASLLTNGKVLVANGSGAGGIISSCELYTPCPAPTFSVCPSNIKANTETGTCGAAVSYTATAIGTPDPTNTYSFSGATTGNGNGTGSGSTFNRGPTNVSLTASNGCGSDTTCNFTVTIMDTEKPTIFCTADVTINTKLGLCTGTASLINPTVRDNCSTIGNALNFDGGYVDVPNNVLLNPVDQLTIETWVKRTSSGIQESLIEKYANQTNTFGYLLRITSANKAFTMVLNNSFQGSELAGSTTILPNVWYHLAATFNRNTGVLKLYVNGILDGQITGITGFSSTPGSQSLKIGARGDDAATRLTNGGVIDEARIWDIERTQAQIQANMNRELSAQAGLVALYHFNQGTAGGNNSASPGPAVDAAIDASGNVFNGILNGFTLNGSTSNWVIGKVDGENLSVTNDAPAEYPIGNTIVTWTATDESNNSSTCTQTVTVVDDQQPVITCPAVLNIDRDTDEGGNAYTAVGTEFDATATDNCEGTSLTYTLTGVTTGTGTTLAGAVFESGITTITWTATDGATTSVSCSFTLTVLENVNPQLHWTNIAAGGDSSYGIKSDGTLWAWGYNQDGQVGTDTNWKTIAAGGTHAVALKTDGTLWAWGQNGGGQLGDGTTIDKSSPILITTDTNWQSISTGVYHTIAIKNDGTLWAWGYNAYGQLGNGANADITIPTQIGTDTNWKSIAGGAFYTVAIKTDGTLWAWGDNTYGQIGDGTNFRRNIPVQIGTEINWKSISAGAYHTIAIKSNATLWTWGQNVNGRLGDGTFTDRNSPGQIGTEVRWQIAGAGGNHSIAKKTNGTLWAWGFNGEGQLGDGTNTEKNTPILIGTETNWHSIVAGGKHTIGLKSGGMEFCATGSNNSGQLGDGTNIYRNTFLCIPITDPYAITCPVDKTVNIDFGNNTAIIDNIDPILIPNNAAYTYTLSGDTVATGSGTASGLTFNKGVTTVTYTLTSDVPKTCSFIVTVLENENPQLHWKSIATVGFHNIGIKTDGTIWAWGYNINGQLGDGSNIDKNSPLKIGTDTNWKSILTGRFHSGAIKTDGTFWAWGQNGGGQLGDGTNIDKNSPIQIGDATNWQSASAGEVHTVGIKTDGTLWAWGGNFDGQLGDGTNIGKNIPVQISTATDWMSVVAGQFHTVAIKTDGTIWAWGKNSQGQLGDGTNINKNTPIQIGTANNWKVISTGYLHTVGIKTDGTLWTWGYNIYGQLGDGTNINKNTPIQIGTASNWKAISAGYLHTVSIKTDGTLWSWGGNFDGQLGDGTNINKNIPLQIGIDTNWQSLSAGDNCTTGVKTGGLQFCATGYNGEGELGDGTFIDKNSFICIPINEPYTISCPTDKITNTDTGFCTAIVSDIDPIATPTDSAYSYSLSGVTSGSGSGSGSASGLTFNKGETTVTYTLTADVTKTCSFKVTVNGEVAGALSFDGINDYVSISHNHLLKPSSQITIEAWVNPNTIRSIRHYEIYRKDDEDARHLLSFQEYGTILSFGLQIAGVYTELDVPISYSDYENQWVHIAATFDGITKKIYRNNMLIGSENKIGAISIAGTSPVIIGAFGGGAEFFNGKIDEVRLWNRALCLAEIVNNMTGELILPQSGLIAYYKFNQGFSACSNAGLSSLLDSSGNNLNGTLNNFALTGSTSNWTNGTVDGISPSFEHTPPVMTCPAALSVTIDAPATTAIVNFAATATDDSGISSITYSKNPGTAFPIGITTVIATATDNNCNTISCSFAVTVLENINPQIHWVNISSGSEHTVGIKSEGTIWAWGNNAMGQLGDGTYANRNKPLQIGTAKNWKSIATGAYHTMAIKSDNTLWTWGYNSPGTLGDGTNTNRNTPMQIGISSNWQSVVAGFDHTVAIKTDGTLWTWGGNGNGQLGNGTNIRVNIPLQIGTDTNWKSIAAGAYHTLAIKSDGTLWAWGFNVYGQLGDGTNIDKLIPIQIGTNTNWKSIESGYYSTQGIRSDGTLWAWGWGGNGNLGDGTNIDRNIPIQIGVATNWQSIDAGYAHTIGIQSDGTLWAWGFNVYGQLGDGTTIDKNIPIQIGNSTSWKSISTGAIYSVGIQSAGLDFCATGNNDYGQLGDGTNIAKNSFVCIPMPEPCILPMANAGSSAAICAGSNVSLGTAAVAGNTYNWVSNPVGFISTVANPTVSPTVTTTYTLTETVTTTACTKSNSITITVNPLPVVTYGLYLSVCLNSNPFVLFGGSPLGGFYSGPGVSFGMFYPLVAGVGTHLIFYSYTDINGCNRIATGTITVNQIPIASAGAPSTICSGANVMIGAAAVIGNTYSWVSNPAGFTSTMANPNVSPTVTTIYTLTETAAGCSKSNAVTITVNPLPLANVGTSSSICSGASIALGATALIGNTYSWVSSPAGFTSTSANPLVSPTATTTYTLTETVTATGCLKSNSVTITVNPLLIVTLGTFSPVCINTTSFGLTGGLPSGGIYSGNGVSLGSFNSSVAGVGTHLITYTYTDGNGCSDSAISSIQVNGPIANAGLDTTVYIGYTQNKCATLSGSASGGLPPYKYLWSTGAKTASINVCPTVTATYTLKVTDARGCSTTDNVDVKAVDITCAKNSVYVCHYNAVTNSYSAFCVKTNDVKMHLAHGDYLGTCSNTISVAKNMNTSDIENNDTFLLYPNPTTGSFTVEVCKNDVVEEAKLQVANVLGQIIYSKKIFKIDGCIKETIELNHALPEGTYFLNLIIGKIVETKKLVLKK
ncbi:kelch repeat-containing protein [Flavobacterium sp. XS2P24]|uniref:RCC1 domain-containing protein n=1 Tax=Flavobacterium sp. XS2P24 TaxID=3041249 RepID=UPI0024A94F6C|nr:LamG-like jellyroll fold domain-containing protein [Flavobacterium sp. XS2P24]MDI6050789.1 kelch repeat-containing protein [Flavobacterium sp. XS2P24]